MSETDSSLAEAHTEEKRLAALERYSILDTPPEPSFDRITRLTRAIFEVDIAAVTLIDAHRQWFKSQQGMVERETPRGPALCNMTIRSAVPLIVPDTLKDDRFRDNPFVTGAPFVRFYGGVPLVMPGGVVIGTLCAMHPLPLAFSARSINILRDLAGIVVDEIARRPSPQANAHAPQASDAPAPSRRMLKAGRISFNGDRSVIDCTVKSLSDSGASLLVNSSVGIPEIFRLSIPAENWSRICRATTQRDKHVEVAFE